MKVSCLLLTCELAICDGGHCLQIFQSRLFTCEVLSVCFLFWVGGSDWWFGTSVEDNSGVTKESRQLARQAWGIQASCVFVSRTNIHSWSFPRICSLAHISNTCVRPTTDWGHYRFHKMKELFLLCFLSSETSSIFSEKEH